MRWPSGLRASCFFVVAGAIWFSVGLIQVFRGGSGATIDVYLRDWYFVLSAAHFFLFPGCIFLVFGGVYGLFEQRHAQLVNLILGQVHFWLTTAPLAVVSHSLYRFSQVEGAVGGDVNVQSLLETQRNVFLWCVLTLLLGQFVFLANLAITFFRQRAGAR